MAKRNPIPNSKPFEKGRSGNPNGRPKKLPGLDEILGNVLGDEKNGVTAAEAIIMSLRQQALKGNVQAAKLLLDRAYGESKKQIDHTTNGDSLNSPFNNLPLEKQLKILEIMEDDSKPT
jgi:Family of unknown function (DUF5681)